MEADDEDQAREKAADVITRPAIPDAFGGGWSLAFQGALEQNADIEDSDQETYLFCKDEGMEFRAPSPG